MLESFQTEVWLLALGGAVYPFTGKTFSLNSLLGRCDCFYDFAKYFWRKSGSLTQRYVKRHASGRNGAKSAVFIDFSSPVLPGVFEVRFWGSDPVVFRRALTRPRPTCS